VVIGYDVSSKDYKFYNSIRDVGFYEEAWNWQKERIYDFSSYSKKVIKKL